MRKLAKGLLIFTGVVAVVGAALGAIDYFISKDLDKEMFPEDDDDFFEVTDLEDDSEDEEVSGEIEPEVKEETEDATEADESEEKAENAE